MTDLSEYARLADWLEEGQGLYANTDKKLCIEALRFRANASEEVIARGLKAARCVTPDGTYVHASTQDVTRAVLAALEKPATTTVT